MSPPYVTSSVQLPQTHPGTRTCAILCPLIVEAGLDSTFLPGPRQEAKTRSRKSVQFTSCPTTTAMGFQRALWQWLTFVAASGLFEDFLWISQSYDEISQWLQDIATDAHSFVLVGIFGPCTKSTRAEKTWRVCLERGLDSGRGTNRLIKVANSWETERRKRFHYVIYADDNGAFTFRADCSPGGCGDIGATPRKNETAPLFFQRLLLQHQPAVASPIMGDDSEPERMFICASIFDRKITAHHWSVRHHTLLVLEEFLEVSMLAATTCALNELVEATYRGHTILYRPFQRAGNGTRYYEHRGNYIRNMHPCLPRKVADGWEDSQLVSWMRPQLSRCASEQLGPSVYLQRGRPVYACLKPPRNVDYSRFLPCTPWARPGDDDFCVKKPTANRRPKADGQRFVDKFMRGMVGHGWPDLPRLDPTKARDRLCILGRRNYKGLVRHYASRPAVNGKIAHLPDGFQCDDPCNALLFGAALQSQQPSHVVAAQPELQAIDWQTECMTSFLRSWSMMDLLGGGWSSMYELMQQEVERRSQSQLETRDPVELTAAVPPEIWQSISILGRQSWGDFPCQVDTFVRLILPAAENSTLRAGRVHAAQTYIFSCAIESWLHPSMASVWAVIALIGRLGVNIEVASLCDPEKQSSGGCGLIPYQYKHLGPILPKSPLPFKP
ncbi:unnamed protein product [Symbiodinium sp. CCMP2456]|nr:unnamed protein product [Symbiodinium sp. CCMP2456]